eukprot:9220258-Ditylum_brightwellii.AAC.1
MNYLEKSTRPDIAYAGHQCAQFLEDPRVMYGEVVSYLANYLATTRDLGVILHPDQKQSFE